MRKKLVWFLFGAVCGAIAAFSYGPYKPEAAWGFARNTKRETLVLGLHNVPRHESVLWFSAADSKGRTGLPGHAMIFARTSSDKERYQDVSGKAFGFRPVREMTSEEIQRVAQVPGFLCDDEFQRFPFRRDGESGSLVTNDTLRGVVIAWIDQAAFDRAVAVIRRWKEKNIYHPMDHDCITFMQEVAGAAGLSVPPRGGALMTPRAYQQAFIDANRDTPGSLVASADE